MAEILLNLKLNDKKFNINSVKYKQGLETKYSRFFDFFYEAKRFEVENYRDYKEQVEIIIKLISNVRQLSVRDLLLINYNQRISTRSGDIDFNYEVLPDKFFIYAINSASVPLENFIFPNLPQNAFFSNLTQIILRGIIFSSESFNSLAKFLQNLKYLSVLVITSNSKVKSNDLTIIVENSSKFKCLTKIDLQIKTERNVENGKK